MSNYPVTFEADYAEQRSRLTTFFRLLLAIPHLIVLYVWGIGVFFAVLVACGFFMSFQFTAYNSIAYDEIPPERMSSATSFYATFQQLMLSQNMITCRPTGLRKIRL